MNGKVVDTKGDEVEPYERFPLIKGVDPAAVMLLDLFRMHVRSQADLPSHKRMKAGEDGFRAMAAFRQDTGLPGFDQLEYEDPDGASIHLIR